MVNDTTKLVVEYAAKCKERFPKEYLIGIEMGVAYGETTRALAKEWTGQGIIAACDTFEGHPEYLAPEGSPEQICMRQHYDEKGKDTLSLEWQQQEADESGLTNIIFKKGLISELDLPYAAYHFAFLDMDIVASMQDGWSYISNKLKPASFLLFHDCFQGSRLENLINWFNTNVRNDPRFKIIQEDEHTGLIVMERI